jgi:hypothetical protein
MGYCRVSMNDCGFCNTFTNIKAMSNETKPIAAHVDHMHVHLAQEGREHAGLAFTVNALHNRLQAKLFLGGLFAAAAAAGPLSRGARTFGAATLGYRCCIHNRRNTSGRVHFKLNTQHSEQQHHQRSKRTNTSAQELPLFLTRFSCLQRW